MQSVLNSNSKELFILVNLSYTSSKTLVGIDSTKSFSSSKVKVSSNSPFRVIDSICIRNSTKEYSTLFSVSSNLFLRFSEGIGQNLNLIFSTSTSPKLSGLNRMISSNDTSMSFT